MKVFFTSGYPGEINDELCTGLYISKHMTLHALVLIQMKMKRLGILSFESSEGNFVSIGSIEKQIEEKRNR